MSGRWVVEATLPDGFSREAAEGLAVELVSVESRLPAGAHVAVRGERPADPVLAVIAGGALDDPDVEAEVEPCEAEVAVDVRFVVARTDGFQADADAWEQGFLSWLGGVVGTVLAPAAVGVEAQQHDDGWFSISAQRAPRPLGVIVGVDAWRTVEGPRA